MYAHVTITNTNTTRMSNSRLYRQINKYWISFQKNTLEIFGLWVEEKSFVVLYRRISLTVNPVYTVS